MLLLSHTITGAVIGQKINDPTIIILLAFTSHFILDRIPHWNYNVPDKFDLWEFSKTLPDIITSILVYLVFLFAYPDQWLNISLGVCFAILPDFLTLTQYIPGLKILFKSLNKFHLKIQGHINKRYKTFWGLLSQIIYITLLIIIFVTI